MLLPSDVPGGSPGPSRPPETGAGGPGHRGGMAAVGALGLSAAGRGTPGRGTVLAFDLKQTCPMVPAG